MKCGSELTFEIFKQMTIWQDHLAEIFEFFVEPLHPQFETGDGMDDVMFLIGKCFRSLDCDQVKFLRKIMSINLLLQSGEDP